jgi:hypothetical protein
MIGVGVGWIFIDSLPNRETFPVVRAAGGQGRKLTPRPSAKHAPPPPHRQTPSFQGLCAKHNVRVHCCCDCASLTNLQKHDDIVSSNLNAWMPWNYQEAFIQLGTVPQ